MMKVHAGRRALALIAAFGLIGLAASSATAIAAPKASGPTLTAPQIAKHVQPAAELIETDVAGSLTYYKLNVNIDALVAWAKDDTNVQNYGNAGAFADASRAIISELAAHPNSYITKGDSVAVNDELVYDGSGWNVTPDGYIITNSHVAVISKDAAVQGFVHDTLQSAIDALTKSLEGQLDLTFSGTTLPLPDDQKAPVQAIVTNFIDATTQVGAIKTTVYVGGGPTLSRNLAAAKQGLIATVVDSGDVYPGKDVAILKIEAQNLPTLPLGDDTTLQTGDGVHAIGYPGDATFDPSTISTTVTAQSTQSDGTVSNRLQSSKANFQFIENTATMNHGSSGGALVNDQGKVVGITTALDKSSEAANGDNGGKFFYALPVSVVNEFLQKNHITPSQSPDQVLFYKALDLMDQSHYKAALKDLRQIQVDGFKTSYLQQRLDEANRAAAAGQDKAVSSSSKLPVIAGGGGVVVLLLVGLLLILRSRKRRKAAPVQAMPWTGGTPVYAYGNGSPSGAAAPPLSGPPPVWGALPPAGQFPPQPTGPVPPAPVPAPPQVVPAWTQPTSAAPVAWHPEAAPPNAGSPTVPRDGNPPPPNQ